MMGSVISVSVYRDLKSSASNGRIWTQRTASYFQHTPMMMMIMMKIKSGAPDFPRCPLAEKFLYRALVRVNAYINDMLSYFL